MVAAEVARIVCEAIATPAPDAARTAPALHHAIREIRAQFGDSPALWAAHIHVGPRPAAEERLPGRPQRGSIRAGANRRPFEEPAQARWPQKG